MPLPISFVCDLSGIRVDGYVSTLMPAFSRSYIQKLIKAGDINVNGKPVKSSIQLQKGDFINIHVPDFISKLVAAEPFPLDIIYENDQVIVVNKPSGMTVHPAPGHQSGTLVNALIGKYPELRNIGDPDRPGVVHRLDADTSGVMVIARSETAYGLLSQQMSEHTVSKTYIALVFGYLEPLGGIIDAPIGRHPIQRKKMSVIDGGRKSETEYSTLRKFDGYTLVEVHPYTGRTHQIRVHMSAIGHPIVGDNKYGGKVPFLKRQFLHSHKLGFYMPGRNEWSEFTASLSPDLEKVLLSLTDFS